MVALSKMILPSMTIMKIDCSLVEYDDRSGHRTQGAGNDGQKENIIEATVEERPNSLYQHVEKQIFLLFESTEEIFVVPLKQIKYIACDSKIFKN